MLSQSDATCRNGLLLLFRDTFSVPADCVQEVGRKLLTYQLLRLRFSLFVEHPPVSILRQIFSIRFTFGTRTFDRALSNSLLTGLILLLPPALPLSSTMDERS